MKKKIDLRHKKRQKILKELFSLSFNPSVGGQALSAKTKKIIAKLSKIDKMIEEAASEWPINQIAKVDLSILRLAIYELCFEKKEPPKAIIDEAVELGKEYGSESSYSFINGVLGTVVKKEGILK